MAKALPPTARYNTAAVPVGVTRYGQLGSITQTLLSLAATGVVAAWIGYYLVALWPSIALEAFRATITMHAVTALVLFPYLVSLVIRRRLPGGSPLDLPVVLAVGAYLLATATSLNWRVSLESTLVILMAVSGFFVLADGNLFRRRQVEAGVMLAALAAAVWALKSVADVYMDYLDLTRSVEANLTFADYVPPTVPRVNDVGDHPNILAMALAMALPFFVAALARRGDAHMRLLGVVGLPIVALALFFTLSRGAWSGALLGVALTVVLMVALLPGGRAIRSTVTSGFQRSWRTLITVVAVSCIVMGIAAVLVAAMRWESRPEWLFRDSTSPRIDMFTTGVDIYKDYPLLGSGPDTFGLLYPEYSGENPLYHYHTHNGFLQTAVDTGIPGILAMCILGGALFWMVANRLRRAPEQAQLSLIAASSGILAFSVHSLVDAPNQAKTALMMLAAVAAIAVLAAGEADGAGGQPEPRPRVDLRQASQFLARAFIPIAMAGLLIAWVRLDAASYQYSNGLANANSHHWAASARDMRRAVELDPELAVYRFQYGNVLARLYLESGRPGEAEEAVVQMKRGLELEPRSPVGHTNLALLYAELESRENALASAEQAIRYANRDPAVMLAAGYALERSGWEEQAIDAYATAMYFDGNLADSPFWRGTTFRQRNFGEIIGSSALIFNACALLDLSNHGAPAGTFTREQAFDACRQHTIDVPADLAGRATLAEAITRSGGPPAESRQLLDGVLHTQPDFGPALTALGLWYKNEGDVPAARQQWVRAGQLNETDALVMLGDTYEPGAVPTEVIDALRARIDKATSEVQLPLTAILYYRRIFYRASPIDILLPGDWQGAVPGRYSRAIDAIARWTTDQ